MPDVRGLTRQRVLNVLEAVRDYPVALLIAPAGSGKTTTLVQHARTTDLVPVWYRAEPTDTAAHVLECLQHALCDVVAGLDDHWTDIDAAADTLAGVQAPRPVVLLLDDLHELRGSSAEAVIERLLTRLPTWLSVIATARHTPGFNLADLRVSGRLVEVPDDVLRWRPWEVERLFAEFYRERLRPEEAAHLTQRTEGWAAGLQLFHLASQHLPVARRTGLIDDLHTRPGLVRDYLTRNVIGGLPEELRVFLIDTCVLGRLDPPLCDALRNSDDAAAHLAELEARRLFLVPREDGRGYRYHEVLRAYLEISLLDRDGPVATRRHYRRAGRLLEADGAIAEAVHANARAESWDDVARLLGKDGPVLAAGNGGRVLGDLLPPALVHGDPWLRLAQARELVADGCLLQAAEAYRAAKSAFGPAAATQICDDELAAVQPWIDSREHPVRGLTDLLRAATRRDPAQMALRATASGSAVGRLVGAVSMLLAGNIGEADRLAREAGSAPDAEIFVMAAAQVVEHVAALVRGAGIDQAMVLRAAETFEHLGATWCVRLVRTIGTSQADAVLNEAVALREVLRQRDDLWGPPLMALIAGIASTVTGRPRPELLETAAMDFRALGAATMEAWARAWGALAIAITGGPEPVVVAEEARSLARSTLVPGAELVAELALAANGHAGSTEARIRAVSLAQDLGLSPLVDHYLAPKLDLPPLPEVQVNGANRPPSSLVACFGGLRLVLVGREIDLSGLKPQARALLARIAMQAGTPLHRERLVDALWPDDPPDAGARKLHVLISTLRRYLEPEVEAGDWTLLVRTGEAYALRVAEDAHFDLRSFDEATTRARRCRRRGDADGELSALQDAFDAYSGELLPEFGAAEWVVADRERYCDWFTHVAQTLASWYLQASEHDAAVEVAMAGLRADRYRSRLWELLVDAHRGSGDLAAATRTEAEHAAVLAELGLQAPLTTVF